MSSIRLRNNLQHHMRPCRCLHNHTPLHAESEAAYCEPTKENNEKSNISQELTAKDAEQRWSNFLVVTDHMASVILPQRHPPLQRGY